MSATSYKQMTHGFGKDKYAIRLTLVKFARAHGVRATAREYDCSRNTVRHWLREFEKIATYRNWRNFARPNYTKGSRTPADILEEEGQATYSSRLMAIFEITQSATSLYGSLCF